MFSGEMARLRGPLFWFLGDGLSAAALSMNWDENFFVELAAMPTLDVSADKAARQLAERVREMPDLVEDYVLRLNPQPYGRRVVARFPAMVRKLAAYTRSGVEDGCVVLRCYLPAVAGHNLIMGAELTLAEMPGAAHLRMRGRRMSRSLKRLVRRQQTTSVREILARKTSLSFTRDSLEAALEQLSQDIGVEIVIVGPDLQADGITRNQQLGSTHRESAGGRHPGRDSAKGESGQNGHERERSAAKAGVRGEAEIAGRAGGRVCDDPGAGDRAWGGVAGGVSAVGERHPADMVLWIGQ